MTKNISILSVPAGKSTFARYQNNNQEIIGKLQPKYNIQLWNKKYVSNLDLNLIKRIPLSLKGCHLTGGGVVF